MTSPSPAANTARRQRPPMRWVRVVAALGLLAVAAWAVATGGPALVHAHPAYVVLLVLALAAGVALVVHRRGRPGRLPWRIVRTGLGGTAWLLVVAVLVLARPVAATDRAEQAMTGTSAVRVAESSTRIVLTPTAGAETLSGGPAVGLAFYPGGFVDPRAYVAVLSPVVAAGHPVVIVKPPLGAGFLVRDAVAQARSAVPGVRSWAVGGHSLGGVAAAAEAGAEPTRVAGLVLWASFPASSLRATAADLPAVSVYGTRDGASTPEEVLGAAPDLPTATSFVPIEGANHAQFGDYGPQRGDLEPTTARDEAQRQIAAATIAFLDALVPSPSPRG